MRKIILLLLVFSCFSCSFYKKNKPEVNSLITPPNFNIVPNINENEDNKSAPSSNLASKQDIKKLKKALLK
jgi:hypothetical protein